MKKTCSFCGRSENEVKLLITGLNGHICEECAKQAYDIACSAGFAEEEDEKDVPALDLSLIHISEPTRR